MSKIAIEIGETIDIMPEDYAQDAEPGTILSYYHDGTILYYIVELLVPGRLSNGMYVSKIVVAADNVERIEKFRGIEDG